MSGDNSGGMDPVVSGGVDSAGSGGLDPAASAVPADSGGGRSMVRLMDFMAGRRRSTAHWGPLSVAYSPVDATHLYERLHVIAGQAVALSAINDALISLGEAPCQSLHPAITKAFTANIIDGKQRQDLLRLNRDANTAKHQI